MEMFCYQCEQTAKGKGCTIHGVCGKDPEVAALQDLLTYALIGLSQVAQAARAKGVTDAAVNRFTSEAAFSTLTNVNFDPERFMPMIKKAVELRDGLKAKAGVSLDSGAAVFKPAADKAGMLAQAQVFGFKPAAGVNEDVASLQHITMFGVRGVAAYADHAAILNKEDDSVYAYMHEAMAATQNPALALGDWGRRLAAKVRRGHPEGHGAAGRGQTPAPTATPCPPWCPWATRRARPSWSPATTSRTSRPC